MKRKKKFQSIRWEIETDLIVVCIWISINSKEDGIKLIEDDSTKQEEKCNNQLYDIENELKNNTNI